MSAFSGINLTGQGIHLPAPGFTTNLGNATYETGQNVSVSTSLAAFGARAAGTTSAAHKSVAGAKQEMFGGQLFEKIIVIPRVDALGFVITATEFPVEVWNAYRSTDQTLTSIAINGSGGLTLADPFGEPLLYAAMDSRIYQATIPTAGSPQISQDIVFTFAGGITGTDCQVTGSRIVVFSVQPDWSAGIDESIEFLTDVLKGYSDFEQRRALRQLPRRAVRIRPLALTARNAAGMESLVWGWQNQPYGVPWWQDAVPLTANISAGSFTIPCNTADRAFASGGFVLIRQDEFTFEALLIQSVAANSITTTSPTQNSWNSATAVVMPVFLARLPKSVEVVRHASFIDEMELEFIGEALQVAPQPAATFTQYKGFDVLEFQPNWVNALNRKYDRSIVTIDPKIGPIEVIDKGGSAVVSQKFPWWLDGHANVTTFRAFLLRRFGRMNPFWVPTWDQDLILANDIGPTDTAIKIQSEFYSRFFFPSTARRDLAFIPAGGAPPYVYHRITAAADNGDGTETLTLDASLGVSMPAATTQVSFLTLARLADDKSELRWLHADHAEAELEFQEVPREIP